MVRQDILKYKNGSKKFSKQSAISRETLDVNDIIMDFFCNQFSKQNINTEHDYKFSISYTRRLKFMNSLIAPEHQHERFDGIVYPKCCHEV